MRVARVMNNNENCAFRSVHALHIPTVYLARARLLDAIGEAGTGVDVREGEAESGEYGSGWAVSMVRRRA